jgi:hypothetical protein
LRLASCERLTEDHRIFQKPTQIAQITLISLMGPDRLTESVCETCEISVICVGFGIAAMPALYQDDRDSSTTRFALRSE